ncbi:formate dehydrogenase subunit delta [Pseudomonas sp. LA21]|uniref:formate dehydrogenase subunit delta n=1 Tax=unclassified Pseudomonas TaxID=196821 RepID=UPI001FB84F7F|nr:formate dehydrogenase subunit delta [Pseudomonas sp. LA21]MCJ1886481.1 formate dehydrogenase subunit delta [Pseudomonas sp. LA21]
MNVENLIKMANQIGQYFASEPDREQAVRGVHQHLKSFWTPAMLRDLKAWLERHPDGDLHLLVQAALLEETAKA